MVVVSVRVVADWVQLDVVKVTGGHVAGADQMLLVLQVIVQMLLVLQVIVQKTMVLQVIVHMLLVLQVIVQMLMVLQVMVLMDFH